MAKYTSKFFQPGRSYLLTSFIGVMDIKIGVTIVTLFALLNKVAGVYGVLAVFTGGTFAQVSMYLYSIATIAALIWGMKAVGEVGFFRYCQLASQIAHVRFNRNGRNLRCSSRTSFW